MDFGEVLFALGLDLRLLQGAVSHLYREDERLQRVVGSDGSFRLELAVPLIETRPPCGDLGDRMGVRLQGDLFLGTETDARVFDAWVTLAPTVLEGDDGVPVGGLAFVEVESVTPDFARTPLEDLFAADGVVGEILAGLSLSVFASLLESATRVFDPPDDPEAEVTIVPADWAVAFRLGLPSDIPRPVYDVVPDDQVVLDLDISHATVPALLATVARAGSSPLMPGDASVVRAGTGMQLVTSKAMLDARLGAESAAQIGTEKEGITIDKLDLEAVDGGITVDGAGHKTGATVTFEGTVVARYQGGTDGHLVMKPAIETDVETAWWVDLLSVVCAVIPGLGWILGDVFIWSPIAEAPGTVDDALEEQFLTALEEVAAQVAEGLSLPAVPSGAFLHDVWIFDGNLGVAVVALLGYTPAEIANVSYDTAYLLPERPPRNRKRPVKSVAEITLSTGQTVRPWQAAALVRDGLVDIPDHHVVRNPLARGGLFLRSDPNDTETDNLVR